MAKLTEKKAALILGGFTIIGVLVIGSLALENWIDLMYMPPSPVVHYLRAVWLVGSMFCFFTGGGIIGVLLSYSNKK